MLVYGENRIELRLEEKEGEERTAAFGEVRRQLEEYLSSQGITSVEISLSENAPQQHQKSGKFKHIVNMQKEN